MSLKRKAPLKAKKGLNKVRKHKRIDERLAKISENELDKKFRKIVHLRGSCEAAHLGGCSGPLECSHRMNCHWTPTRWDEDNADLLCQTHHRKFEASKLKYRKFVGGRKWDELERRARGPDPDLAEVNKRLSARLKELAW